MEKWADSKIVYKGTVFKVRVGEVSLDNGMLAHREVVEHPGGVGIVPFTGHSVILVKQFRIALNEYIEEIPAGKLEGEEDPEHRGRCELEEETGYTADRVIDLGSYYATVGFCSEEMHLFLAAGLTHVGQKLEEEERIELVELTLEEVRAGLDRNRFKDAKTAICLQKVLDHIEGRI